ncbi:hypothetical protein ACHAW6_005127 [Cyclotella cf. meneghiniana]
MHHRSHSSRRRFGSLQHVGYSSGFWCGSANNRGILIVGSYRECCFASGGCGRVFEGAGG